ncbi:MAG TPA: tRNA (cytidine(34)-2'-O)-methyltransferase [Burkholderiales bacterium]|jgi:tRNA (cytidine/uridine-2'-O-)-methyltransferase|nr:tRNA (cytidine(34)-2'-O)-methyltransferase [Burkholderiales bacterium]
MIDLVLYEPEIPPNTGNLIRLAANSGSRLHLVKPLGFQISDRALQRAGLDYDTLADVTVHEGWSECRAYFAERRLYALSTRGTRLYTDVAYAENDVLICGPETRGLPEAVLNEFPAEQRLRLPMLPQSRSLNLSNAAAIVVYEAWRQLGFKGGR